MSQFYKILKADPLGTPWTPDKPGAKPIQNFWCQVEGQDLAVSIGKQVPNTVTPGEHVYGDLFYAKSQKSGNEYWKFKSQQVPPDVQRPANSPTPAAQPQQQPLPDMSATMPDWFMPVANQIDYIFREMRKMDSSIEQLPAAVTPVQKPEPVVEKPEQIAGEPVDEETKAVLEDIFTPPEVPEGE